MDRDVKIDHVYRHFKGHTYKVIAIAYDSEKYNEKDPSKSKMVVYKNIENDEVWVRPYDMFNSLVDKNKYPDVKQKYRFEEVEI